MRMLILFLVSLVFTSLCFSSTIHVPADYRSIQEAIDKSQDGDTVLVSPGTYYESINFLGKTILVKGIEGAESTVIEGCNADYVVRFKNQETLGSILEGFTITNGLHGIRCDSSSPSLLKNIIERNQLGGGVVIIGPHSSPFVYGNLIRNNYSDHRGGGILCEMSTSAIIEGNIITKNSCKLDGGGLFCDSMEGYEHLINNNIISFNSSHNGGGLFLSHHGDYIGKISNNIICNNTAESLGGGILCDGNAEISNNIILENISGSFGGGIFISGSDIIIFNNIICKNISDSAGGGIKAGGWSGPFYLMNNTISGNIGGAAGGIDCLASSIIIRNTIFWGNQSKVGQYPEIWGTPDIMFSIIKGGWSGSTNIDTDPCFSDPERNDYRLLSRSPCINRGTSDEAPIFDFEGEARPCMGNIDIGADEYTGIHSLELDAFVLSAGTGGMIDFTLSGGLENAGRTYLMLGCTSGTLPGTTLPGAQAVLPLMLDPFSGFILTLTNTTLFNQFFSALDATGHGSAQLNTLGLSSLPPEWVGVVMHFAFTLDSPWEFVSNPVAIEIVD